MFLDQSPLETVLLSIFDPKLGPSWGHFGTVSDTFSGKKLSEVALGRRFLTDLGSNTGSSRAPKRS